MAAQPPQHKSEPAKKAPEQDMKVPVPGSPPKLSTADQPAGNLPEATQAEQAAGKAAVKAMEERLKEEQEAGSRIVGRNKDSGE